MPDQPSATKKLKRVLNYAILSAALLFCGVAVKKLYFVKPADYKIAPHARLTIKGVDWTKADRTLVLALKKDCRYCTESAQFYRKLVRELANEGNTQVIALFPEKETGGDAYLSESKEPDPLRERSP
jgi:hypothetical protein